MFSENVTVTATADPNPYVPLAVVALTEVTDGAIPSWV